MTEKVVQITIVVTYPFSWENYKSEGIEEGDYEGALNIDRQAYNDGHVELTELINITDTEEVEFKIVDAESDEVVT